MSFKLKLISIIVLWFEVQQRFSAENSQIISEDFYCKCMDYWQCFAIGGQVYSYCAFSNEVCCVSNESMSYETIETNINKKSALCGKKEFDSGIEEYAEPGEWSWHTAILFANEDLYICGGSLIDEEWVLTASHCVQNIESQKLKVRIGEYDISNTREPERHEEIEVSHIFPHLDFNNKTLVNDIALLKLKNSVKKRPNINIVCLPNNQTFDSQMLLNTKCFITGWGRNSERGEYSPVLKEVNVPLWNHTSCEQTLRVHFGSNYHLTETAICGGDEGHDACDGDGGGGLYCEYDQQWYQIGIISFGIGCGRSDSPGVYTNVMSYLDWIYKITSQ